MILSIQFEWRKWRKQHSWKKPGTLINNLKAISRNWKLNLSFEYIFTYLFEDIQFQTYRFVYIQVKHCLLNCIFDVNANRLKDICCYTLWALKSFKKILLKINIKVIFSTFLYLLYHLHFLSVSVIDPFINLFFSSIHWSLHMKQSFSK